jgi:hypothetical protein
VPDADLPSTPVIRQRPSGTPDGAAKDGADTANKAAANIALCFISETPFTHYTEKLRNGGIIPCPKGKMQQKPKNRLKQRRYIAAAFE